MEYCNVKLHFSVKYLLEVYQTQKVDTENNF